MRRGWPLVACGCALIAACTLDFGKFEDPAVAASSSAEVSSSAASGGAGSGGSSSSASSTSSGSGGAPTCDAQYSDAPAYNACVENDMMCEFGANAQTESCQQICADRGGECLDAFNNQGQCGHGSQLSCSTTNFDSVICVCSRGCGGGPACGAAQTCANGMCG